MNEAQANKYKQARLEIELFLKEKGRMAYLSPVAYRNWSIVFKDYLPGLPKGSLLDIGSANASYKAEIDKKFDPIVFFDLNCFPNAINVRGDVHRLPFKSESFQIILCLQLFEHLAKPNDAIKEVSRVLQKGGTLILSVPHLSRLHEIPYDFLRYTQYGLEQLLGEGQFEIVDLKVTGGLLLFLGHQYSLAFLLTFWKLKWFRKLTIWINENLVVRPIIWIDSKLSKNTRFPQGYVLMAKKK
jgi:SAM-dependent methyltransferase